MDAVAAEEIGSIVAALEAIDADLERRGTTRGGQARKTLLEHKARLTRGAAGVAARVRRDAEGSL